MLVFLNYLWPAYWYAVYNILQENNLAKRHGLLTKIMPQGRWLNIGVEQDLRREDSTYSKDRTPWLN